ncbi:MAG: glycosyltransferase family 2 protein [Acidobacteria bacterium]|nr:glycosyltransferase family 2 protein [Acidobacteriota bacterium]
MTPTTPAPVSLTGIYLSVVIPVYNEGERIRKTLPQVIQYLRARPERCELIVVNDGSTDDTADRLRELFEDTMEARVISYTPNRGKGFAVRRGMLEARGEFALFSDADLSAPITEADRLLEPLENGYDVVIGSRALKREWIHEHQSAFRENAGKIFNLVLRVITGLPFKDTQCGFKAFRRLAAQRIFPLQSIPGFGFDPEILYLAKKFGYRTLEVPVHWSHSEGTKVRMARDGLRMASDLIRIRWNDLAGKYSREGNLLSTERLNPPEK